MGKKKQTKKVNHTPVRIREKQLADGRKHLYLDIYKSGKRSYKMLYLYLWPETGTPEEVEYYKKLNEETMAQAEAKRSVELADLAAGGSRAKAVLKNKMLLKDWMERYASIKEQSGQSDSNAEIIKLTARHLQLYAGDRVRLQDVDLDFCRGFIGYLASAKQLNQSGKPLAQNSKNHYFASFSSAMNYAVGDGYIAENPARKLKTEDRKPIKFERVNRGYLTEEEVGRLMATDCPNEEVKRAFVFACYVGLRISDIRALTWGMMKRQGDVYKLNLRMTKTRDELNITVSESAFGWLPERGMATDADNVFKHLPQSHQGLNQTLRKWVQAAGIDKTISFHCSRHTAATVALAHNVSLYTVSKMLGHRDIKITQVYATLLDKSLEDAASVMGNAY